VTKERLNRSMKAEKTVTNAEAQLLKA
jgi:hypothetical protein